MNKTIVGALVGSLLLGAYLGHTFGPEKIKIETHTVTVEQAAIAKDSSKKKHSVTLINEAKDGSKTTSIVEDEMDEETLRELLAKASASDSKTEKIYSNAVSVDFLAKVQKNNLTSPSFGVMINKEVIGRVTIGLFGFTDVSGGVSLGLKL
jgi:hypothetical protein